MAKRGRQPLFYGWTIVAVATVAMFATGPAQASVLSVFIGPIAQETGWSRTLISGAVSLGTVLSALVIVPTGPILDRYGTRIVIPAAGAVLGGAAWGLSVVSTPLAFYVMVMLIRLTGIGVLIMACTTAAANWFIRQRGRATAFTIIGMALGIAVAPPVAQYIIESYNWRTAWAAFAVAIWLLVVVPGLVWLQRRPEDIGLHPDGIPLPASPPAGSPAGPEEPEWRLREVVRTRALWLVLPAVLMWGLASGGVTFHQVPYLVDRGLAPLSAAGVVSFYALFMGSGSLLFGLMVERIPVRFGLVGCFLAGGVAIIALLLARGPTVLLYSLLYGISVGGKSTLEPVLWANYYGRSSLGTIRGLTWPVQMAGFAAGPVIAGLAYDLVGDYFTIFLIFAVTTLISALLVLLARPPVRRGSRATT